MVLEDAPLMSEKVTPFARSPFSPVHLGAPDCARVARLVEDELQKVLREYEIAGAPPTPRTFPKSRYKVVKSHDNCTAYLDRNSRNHKGSKKKTTSSNGSSGSPTVFDPYYTLADSSMISGSHSYSENDPDECTSNWAMPDIVVSGTVPGTLDDVMYGMMTPDSAEMLLRTAYVDDNLLDGGVLQQLQLPTKTDPFRSVCVKWYVKGMPSSYKKLVSARDFVFVEATGMVTRQDGARLGYMLRHWLDLEGCGELKGLQRGRFSNCAIYTPLSNQTVDIFVRGTVDPGGKMAMSLAIPIAASALLSSSNAVFCSYNKKLVWLLGNKKRGDHTMPVERSNMFVCGMCAKKFGKLSSVGTCRICCVQMCSRCRLNRSLAYVDMQNHEHAGVEHFSGVFCKNCIAQANQTSAFDVAQDEILKGRYGSVTREKTNARLDDQGGRLEQMQLGYVSSCVLPRDFT
uniref:FYVE-type domain-containing protein n=1 Tax=Globisporangium ultimum (strain ATCC 200006 / CBS 805.95 / DAOM BR144) TaxID=431595 RepID=K3WFB4_GLOUD